jgi:hypothetical protein
MTPTQLSAESLTGSTKSTFAIATLHATSSTAPAYWKFIEIQKVPFNGITLGNKENDSNNQLILKSK